MIGHRGVKAAAALAIFLASCREESPEGEKAAVEGHEHGGGAAITIWTDDVELFFEHPPLVAGEPSDPWAVHLTRLEDFQPVRDGRLTLRFVGPDGKERTTVAERPARDGIFIPTPLLPSAGVYRLEVTLETAETVATIPVGDIQVFGSSSELPHESEAAPAGITFLKEQQWTIPFATAQAVEREIPQSIGALGEIVPPPNSVAAVAAPVDGLVLPKHNPRAPVPGEWVEAGERLAILSPVAGENAYAAQRARVGRLEREVARYERLSAVEAIPEQRLVEARHDLEVSRAALEAMGAGSGGGYELELTSPMSGLIAERNLTVGERVSAGESLFTIVDPGTVWVRLFVPAREAAVVSDVAFASFTVEGSSRRYEAGRVVSVGTAVDPDRRSLPLLLEARNRDGSLKAGMLVDARLLLKTKATGVAIPTRALRNEDGLDIAYVQLGGESFERRVLARGHGDFEWTLVTSGIRRGERVVVEGAYQVRLASLNASEIADHGHPH